MFRRLLPIVLAVCALVPTEVLARFLESCRELDRCGCRHDDERPPAGPAVERVDCCEAPTALDRTAVPGVTAPRSVVVAAPIVGDELAAALAPPLGSVLPRPRPRMRGPPARLFATFERWLI